MPISVTLNKNSPAAADAPDATQVSRVAGWLEDLFALTDLVEITTALFPVSVANGGTGLTASPITVALGGTGATSFSSGAYLKGAGAGAITVQTTPIPTADLGSGSASASTFLRGDQTWAQAGLGVYAIRNLVGQNDAATPNTKFGFSADFVLLRNSSDGAVVRSNTGTLTCDLGTTGANGLDTGAQAASTWYHFYFIWNGTTLASLASLVAPSTGPSLPSGYTHWAYAGPVYSDSSTFLLKMRMRGAWMVYETFQTLVSGGTATTETAVATTTVVPPNALLVSFWGYLTGGSISAAAQDILTMRYVSGSDFFSVYNTTSTTLATSNNLIFLMPNLAQNYYYLNTKNSTGTVSSNSGVHGFTIPNGGE